MLALDREHFFRSQRGNLWCRYDGKTLTVYKHDGGYRWCISEGGDNPHYSLVTFTSERLALDDLLAEVNGETSCRP